MKNMTANRRVHELAILLVNQPTSIGMTIFCLTKARHIRCNMK